MEPCHWLWAWLAVANVVGMVLVVLDKRAARRKARRRSEAALLGFALAGGWPAMLLAMAIVRHKTRKLAFLAPFVLMAVLATAWIALSWRFAC